jgi:3',5'-cyclic AMP phosphodiesterase CpdA
MPTSARGVSASAAGPRLVAAGDIACVPGKATSNVECQMAATASLVESLRPDVVLPLGDLQYELGKADDFSQSYDASWGRLKPITRPVPGNHEYAGGKASGYFGYFGESAHAPGGWYSFTLGAWHIIVLNSVCSAVGGCDEASPQYQWLKHDLEQSNASCTLAAWHHPRWSSGLHGSDATFEPFWKLLADHKADVVLSGHDHHYERFAPKAGIVEFVVGTGGRSLYPVVRRLPGSEAMQTNGFGVLELELHDTSYDFAYRPISGFDFTDSGTGTCG